MANYDLPKTADFDGVAYEIRSDWRVAIDIIEAMNDVEIDDEERIHVVLSCFYPEYKEIPLDSIQEAIDYVYWFIGGGGSDEGSTPTNLSKLMDWAQDLPIIISPINRVLGFEVRAVEYLHWWTFLSAYYEMGGDCLFAQVVAIRKKRLQGKKLDKQDQAFYQENRNIIDFKTKLSDEEEALFDHWI